ncbi:MAG: biopolymer transporter ExbD [Pseudomonadota bacterium]
MSLKPQRRRRRLSMTSLIDVIFLLLLFFMLSSTFSRFAEVEVSAGGGQATGGQVPSNILFLRLSAEGLNLNGAALPIEALANRLSEAEDATLLVSVTSQATAQTLTDVLVVARAVPNLPVNVLEAR